MKTITAYLTILFLLLILNSCGTLQRWVCETEPEFVASIEPPATALCTKDAKTMEENYVALKNIDPNNEHDNRVISFTYQQMMDNLQYLIAKAKEKGVDEEQLGFRVYFGAKKENSFSRGNLERIQLGEEGFSTVFFVATIKGKSEDANDYKNIYDIAALNYGGSRRPPIAYESDQVCPIHNVKH